MKKENKMLIIIGILIVLALYNQPFTVICTYPKHYTNFRTPQLDFTCPDNYGCEWEAKCSLSGAYVHPYEGEWPKSSDSGILGYHESASFYCVDINGNKLEPKWPIEVSITGTSCKQIGKILTPRLPSKGYFTTDEDVVVDVKVDGAGEGYIVYGLIKELNVERTGYTSFGIAELDFSNLARGHYTLDVWGQDADKKTLSFDVYGVMDLTYSFEPIQPYNFIEGYIYLKDENDRGLGIYDIDSFDIKIHPKNGYNYFSISCEYLGKDDILGGKWHCTGNTGTYIGDAVIDITVKKNGYIDAIKHPEIKTFIPSLVIEAYCQDLDCPFPNTATLDDTKTFKFYVKHNQELVDASSYYVKVTNPSRTMVDVDITDSVLKSGTGMYQFTYGPLNEVEAWTFTIHAEYLGTDPQTIYPKVSVTKEETKILFNPWIIIVPAIIIGIVWWVKRK